jgi:P-type Ca2+ transporter type 2C
LPHFSVIGYFTNRWLLIAWVSTLGLQVCAVYIPFLQRALHTTSLALEDWVLISIIALPVFIIPELYKQIRWQSRRSKREVREA